MDCGDKRKGTSVKVDNPMSKGEADAMACEWPGIRRAEEWLVNFAEIGGWNANPLIFD